MLELDEFNATERPGWHIWREEEVTAHRDGMGSSRNLSFVMVITL
jgi:hypothetical protein